MGVTGLWKLIDQSGKPVPLETLENKILAIDISIWLHQVIKGFQDAKGATLPNAHLLGLFHRLCKLLFYKIKPIFVFDGSTPQLKHETLRKRAQAKNKLQNEAERLQKLLLESLVKEKVVQQALGPSATNLLSSPLKIRAKEDTEKFDMFKLPPMKDPKTGAILDEPKSDISESDDTSMDDEPSPGTSSRLYKQINIQSIDVTNDKFKGLPADIRHEILTDIKETRKQSSWGRLHELPAQSDDFSSFQMKRLLKRRQVQVSLEMAEKEMGGKTLSLAELEKMFTEEGIVDASTKASKRIVADENSYAFYVNDLMKAKEIAEKNEAAALSAPSPPKIAKLDVIPENDDVVDVHEQMDEDLQRAIQMSLQECVTKDETIVTKTDDDAGGELRLRTEQKRLLGNAAKKLARAYMMEYGGINSNDFVNLVNMDNDDTDEDVETFKYNQSLIFPETIAEKSEVIVETNSKPISIKNSDSECGSISSDADSDLVDVAEIDSDINSASNIYYVEQIEMNNPIGADLSKDFRLSDLKIKTTPIEVFINPDTIKAPDDLFADIFDETVVAGNNNIESNLIEPTASTSKKVSAESISVDSVDISANLFTERHEVISKLSSQSIPQEPLKNVQNISAANILKASEKKAVLNDILQELVNDLNNVMQNGVSNILNDIVGDVDDKPTVTEEPISVTQLFDRECKTKEVEPSNNEINGQNTNKEKDTASSNCTQTLQHNVQESNEKTTSNLITPPKSTINLLPKPSNAATLTNILQDLDKDLSSVKETTISLLDNNQLPTNNAVDTNDDIIEILDDNDVLIKTPSKPKKQSQISAYLSSDSKIKKTTTPPLSQNSEIDLTTPPKIASPFFRKKTSSAKKLSTDSNQPSSSQKLAAKKSLFQNDVSTMVQKAVDMVNECKTSDELTAMATTVRQEKENLEFERNKQDRGAVSVTERMSRECRELLKLFGIPYLIAPQEAEAQCAFLDAIELTHGTITDDSDIWLFGGQTVYKNFFNQQKLVLEYRVEAIDRLFKMNREKMIQLAMLVGSDYTQGISGIGAVTAMEILATFKSTPEDTNQTTTKTMSILSGLRKFRSWWEHSRNIDQKSGLRKKLHNIELNEEFPSARVLDAYLNPIVDESREKFSWGNPDAETLREFAKTKFGWTRSKTDDILMPVLKKMDEKRSQASIRNYFKSQQVMANASITVSKRVQSAINRMNLPSDVDEDKPEQSQNTNKIEKPKRQQKKVSAKKGTRKSTTTACEEETVVAGPSLSSSEIEPTKGIRRTRQQKKKADEGESCSSKKIPKIPDLNPPIRQRVKDIAQFEVNKQKAIEVLKKKKN